MSLSQVYPSLSPSHIRLLEKQQEHAALQALKEASGELLGRMEELGRKGEVMADGGEAIGSVLRNWPHVFSILNLFDKQSPLPSHPDQSNTSTSDGAQDNSNQGGRRHMDDDLGEGEERDLPQLVRLAFGGDGAGDGDGKEEHGGK